MANIIIHSDERKAETNRTLRDYGINPEHATKAQRDMADCVAQKTGEACRELRRFADELMLNCEKLERDNDECVDICIAKNGMITSGQLGEKYAAQIEIPARQYIEKEVPNPDYDPEVENSSETIMERTPVPFNMANVTLKLYAIE